MIDRCALSEWVAATPSRNSRRAVYSEPIILPLNADGQLYALEDEHGRIVGTGTREVCEVLLTIIKKEVFTVRHAQSRKSDVKPN